MKPEEYGDKYSDHLLEQYKLYVEMTDRVSQRRERSNQFFITLLQAPRYSQSWHGCGWTERVIVAHSCQLSS